MGEIILSDFIVFTYSVTESAYSCEDFRKIKFFGHRAIILHMFSRPSGFWIKRYGLLNGFLSLKEKSLLMIWYIIYNEISMRIFLCTQFQMKTSILRDFNFFVSKISQKFSHTSKPLDPSMSHRPRTMIFNVGFRRATDQQLDLS